MRIIQVVGYAITSLGHGILYLEVYAHIMYVYSVHCHQVWIDLSMQHDTAETLGFVYASTHGVVCGP